MQKYPFPKENSVSFNILKVKQPIGEFYIGGVKATDAIAICSADKRRKDGLEEYTGIQRQLDQNRVKEIKKYEKTIDASLPNSIILSLNPNSYFLEGNKIFIKRQ